MCALMLFHLCFPGSMLHPFKHPLQVLAQAKYALELDSPVPLGFFLNEEVPE